MKNIRLWLKRNLYVVLFLLLEFFSVGVFFRYHPMQESGFYSFCAGIKGRCSAVFGGEHSRKALREENRRLQAENAALRATVESSYFSTSHLVDSVCDDTLYKQMYTYIVANVIHATFAPKDNYVMLDAGSNDGVAPGMAVFSPAGIVGIVNRVSPHFSSVISVLHSQSMVSVSLASSGYSGSLLWKGGRYDAAELVDVPAHIEVEIGERVVTSGLSSVYPGGLPVGCVSGIASKEGEEFYRLNVRLSEPYASLDKVYVVKNLYKDEQDLCRLPSGKI